MVLPLLRNYWIDKDIIRGMLGWRISLHGSIVRSHIMSQKLRLINIIPLILAFVIYTIRLPCSEREARLPQGGELRLLRAQACSTSHDCSHTPYNSSIKPQLQKCFSSSWWEAFLEASDCGAAGLWQSSFSNLMQSLSRSENCLSPSTNIDM